MERFDDPPIPLTGIPSKPPADKERLIIELEFVQNLLNIKYLNYLASKNYFDNNDSVSYTHLTLPTSDLV